MGISHFFLVYLSSQCPSSVVVPQEYCHHIYDLPVGDHWCAIDAWTWGPMSRLLLLHSVANRAAEKLFLPCPCIFRETIGMFPRTEWGHLQAFNWRVNSAYSFFIQQGYQELLPWGQWKVFNSILIFLALPISLHIGLTFIAGTCISSLGASLLLFQPGSYKCQEMKVSESSLQPMTRRDEHINISTPLHITCNGCLLRAPCVSLLLMVVPTCAAMPLHGLCHFSAPQFAWSQAKE